MLSDDDLAAWVSGLDDLFGQVAGRFHRAEPRRRARAYVRGLLAPLAGKNGWTLAEAAGDITPDGMQRLLNAAAWDADGVRDDVRDYAIGHLGERDGVLIVDETGFLKKGTKSAGVQRQYSGTAGRIENCQLGVFCAYATSRGRTLIDRELYVPKSWTADRDRCREAAVPDQVEFATKPVLARRMLARALDAGVPATWVTADEAYGGDSKFRRWLEDRRLGYVVAVPSSQTIPAVAGTSRADALVAHAPDEAWKRRSCGDGAKGPRMFDWAVAELPTYSDTTPPGWGRWLLARRSLTRNNKGKHEIAYYLCCAPTGTTNKELIRVAGARWAIEDCFQTAKTDVGLDQYQVRRYDAWYRHITLAMLAHTYLAVTAAIAPKALVAASSQSRWARSSVSWHT
ncbi:IS701 family transposase [Amycolatopsis sp. DG1A-15b]|uniref:IS701 family transposase n=1 Tax=Amycolatopsis sp. DG1A-15b TaxID=3052846 RepID=UPI00255BF92B|nr:IS701 family transposase [Amycolatopsis sp. DG1A-15b]WIX92454.1 IS701 family transposase [Amycolatopsis sp. DG1A-15b]